MNRASKNEPRIKNPIVVAVREQLEHRALWRRGKEKGLSTRTICAGCDSPLRTVSGCRTAPQGGRRWFPEGLKKDLVFKACAMDVWNGYQAVHRWPFRHWLPLLPARQGLTEAGLLRRRNPYTLRPRYVWWPWHCRKLWLWAGFARHDCQRRRCLQNPLRAQREINLYYITKAGYNALRGISCCFS